MENLIQTFYSAFNKLDAETMARCYHKDVVFEDPAFGKLEGEKAKNMWRMLCLSQKGKDFKVTYSNIKTNDGIITAHWEAFYLFSKTGRKVHNIIEAEFRIKDGKIVQHTDRFNLYRWSMQAIGFNGYMLGWTSFFQAKLQQQTNKMLSKFEKNQKPV